MISWMRRETKNSLNINESYRTWISKRWQSFEKKIDDVSNNENDKKINMCKLKCKIQGDVFVCLTKIRHIGGCDFVVFLTTVLDPKHPKRVNRSALLFVLLLTKCCIFLKILDRCWRWIQFTSEEQLMRESIKPVSLK